MRPLNIKLSAFGPYANEIEIPLKDLGTSGLYLITGDTGSGKTTIFDAICFALYGKASGENRDESMLRSKYANAECPTFVELKFLHQGKEYFIKRNPEYTRPSKKGSGETKESASVEFYLPNGTVLSKKDDVRDAIKNLLGLDKEQFSKITMLAQGTFSRLLFSDGKEKSAIFRNLFNTQNYETLQNVLSEKEKECADSVKAGKQIIREHVASIFVNDDNVLSLDVEKAKKNEITTEEIILLLEKLITQDNKLKEKNAKEFNKIKDELELVNKRIGEIEGQEKAKNEIKEISQELKNEIPKRSEFEKNLNNAKEELKQKDKIDLKATKIESELKKYDSINELTEIIKELKSKNEKSNIDLNAKKIRCEEFRIKLDSLKKELESIKDSPIQLAKLQSELEKLQDEKKDLEELEKSFMLVEQRQKDLLAIQNEYRKKDSRFNELNNLYEKMEQAFRDGQAGILAEKLQDGIACPVCGSLEHPKLAALSNDVPSQEKLENAKKDSNDARAEREAFSKKAEGERMALEELKSSLNKATKKILNIDVSTLSKNNIIEKKEYILKSYYSTEENIKKEKLTQRRKEEIEKNIPQIEDEVKILEKECTELNILLEKNLALLLEKENQLSLQKKELSFPNKKEAEEESERLRTLSKVLQKNYEDVHTMLNLHDKKIGELSAKKETLEKNILSNENINLEEEKEKRNNLEQKQNACNEQAKKIAASLKMNTNIYENILRQSKEITEKEKKFQWITALAKTANGKLAEKEKIKLESYVQSTYFDRIINKANLRFMKMTEGQFELTRQKVAQNKQSDFFLNLDVIDHYNGSTRSIKSLSGGESFMASLSLALGLSDEIQSSSGGIQIDCLFVDEGFGSLDPNTLDCAYKALVSLSEGNKLVGLISHVQDLKERIDKQVIVTKTKSGGSSARISI